MHHTKRVVQESSSGLGILVFMLLLIVANIYLYKTAPKYEDLGWREMVSEPQVGFIGETIQFAAPDGQVERALLADPRHCPHYWSQKTDVACLTSRQMQVVFNPFVHVARVCSVTNGEETKYFVCHLPGDPRQNHNAWLSDKVKEL